MNWKEFWEKSSSNTKDRLNQVQRSDENELKVTSVHIADKLELKSTDAVLDVCCGNGVLTNMISNNVQKIVGVDFSENLINNARSNYPYIEFHQADAEDLSKLDIVFFDKIYLQFSYQYFSQPNQGKKVIAEMLKLLKSGGLIFIGDIPNHEKKWNYYNTFLKRFYRITSVWRGKNEMGKFWKKEELDSICAELNVKGNYIKQDEKLPYFDYRFDYLIKK